MTQAWCEAVVKATHEVGSFILNERRNFISSAVEYKGKNDLVSYVDRTAESKLVERLSFIVPEAGFLTEEKTIDPIEKEFQWIIDPLDGTTNFIHGIPCFCISIALHHFGQPVIGVVHELNQDECFYAWKDGGAYMNGREIRTSATADFQQTLIATGFPYHDYSKMKQYMSVFDYCMRNTRGLRRMGSAAADLAYVAAGRFDAFYEYGLNPWDVAAGILLVKEAGGIVTDFSGNDDPISAKEILAATTPIHHPFLEIIREQFKDS